MDLASWNGDLSTLGDDDLRQVAKDVAGPNWLHQPNSLFHGETPDELIRSDRSDQVREVLGRILYVGIS